MLIFIRRAFKNRTVMFTFNIYSCVSSLKVFHCLGIGHADRICQPLMPSAAIQFCVIEQYVLLILFRVKHAFVHLAYTATIVRQLMFCCHIL